MTNKLKHLNKFLNYYKKFIIILQNKNLNFTLRILMIFLFLCGFFISNLPKNSILKHSYLYTLIGLEIFGLILERFLYSIKKKYKKIKEVKKRTFFRFLFKEILIHLNFVNMLKRGLILGIFLEGFKLGS